MADIVRVSCDNKWTYVAVGSEEHDHVLRFAQKGLAHSTSSDVRLKSEAGPLFWELIGEAPKAKQDIHSKIMECLTYHGIGVGTEELRFGKHGDNHNKFSDLSLVPESSSKRGASLSDYGIDEDDIVLTAWPKSRKILPALVLRPERHFILELVDDGQNGERCFVLDEDGGIITASLASNGSEFLRVLPQLAFDSWLSASGCKNARRSRFSVKDHENKILIEDFEDGRTYLTSYATEKKDLERQGMECLLAHGGLGAVIPKYELENA